MSESAVPHATGAACTQKVAIGAADLLQPNALRKRVKFYACSCCCGALFQAATLPQCVAAAYQRASH